MLITDSWDEQPPEKEHYRDTTTKYVYHEDLNMEDPGRKTAQGPTYFESTKNSIHKKYHKGPGRKIAQGPTHLNSAKGQTGNPNQ